MFFVAVLLILKVVGGLAAPVDDFDYGLMENENLLEGDIEIDEDDYDRSAIISHDYLWPNGTIPYEVDSDLLVDEDVLEEAIKELNTKTCLKIIPRTNERDYIKFIDGTGCHTKVGRRGGKHTITLSRGCGHVGIIMHEIGHAIGFYHEHNRSDRDQHLIILWENIRAGKERQFRQRDPGTDWLLTPFSYDSMMLYGSYFFSKEPGKLKTMLGKDKRIIPDHRMRDYLMKIDITRINMLYNNCSTGH